MSIGVNALLFVRLAKESIAIAYSGLGILTNPIPYVENPGA